MSFILRYGLPLALSVFFGMHVASYNRETIRIAQISQGDLISQIRAKQPLLILDVRTKKEYDTGHIPGAINIDFKELKKRIDEIDSFKNATVVVYCERGIRAAFAIATLQQAGFQSILHLKGDMSAWRSNRLTESSLSME